MNAKKNSYKLSLLILTSLCCLTSPAFSAEKQAETKADAITQAISEGTLLLNTRLRYEDADMTGRNSSNAITARMRLGWQSGVYQGFQALAEFEGTHSLNGESNYSPYGTAPKTVIADPETAELNRLQLSWSGYNSKITGGRQRVILDNSRFVGNVGFRQNEQTYDGVVVANQSIEDLTLIYGWVDQVNRIFGKDGPGLQRRLQSNVHLMNASYNVCEHTKLTVYDYYLNIQDAGALSSNTTGASLTGNFDIDKDYKASYRAELAKQTDTKNNAANYSATYYHLYADVSRKPVTVGVGYEVLGSDQGAGFQTPLATGHKFNGFADAFLTTPATGLRDLYFVGKTTLPYDLKLCAFYHQFDSDAGSIDQGDEIDLVLGYKYNKNWSAAIKAADYNTGGTGSAASRNRLWFDINYSY